VAAASRATCGQPQLQRHRAALPRIVRQRSHEEDQYIVSTMYSTLFYPGVWNIGMFLTVEASH
jgi:hypothetical protein